MKTIKASLTYRVTVFVDACHELWLNLRYGWTTQAQRRQCFSDGYNAVESPAHRPPNPHSHPLLHQDFEDGADVARDDLRREDDETYIPDLDYVYEAIRRYEMAGVYNECRELGLISR